MRLLLLAAVPPPLPPTPKIGKAIIRGRERESWGRGWGSCEGAAAAAILSLVDPWGLPSDPRGETRKTEMPRLQSVGIRCCCVLFFPTIFFLSLVRSASALLDKTGVDSTIRGLCFLAICTVDSSRLLSNI